MKLIDYVIQNEEGIDVYNMSASLYDMTTKEYILEGYCPARFKCLIGTPYEKPFQAYKQDKNDCTFRYVDNIKKCNECWNREVLVSTK